MEKTGVLVGQLRGLPGKSRDVVKKKSRTSRGLGHPTNLIFDIWRKKCQDNSLA